MLHLLRRNKSPDGNKLIRFLIVLGIQFFFNNYIKGQNCFYDSNNVVGSKILEFFQDSKFNVFYDIDCIDKEYKKCYHEFSGYDFTISNPKELFNNTDQDIGIPYRQLIFCGKGSNSVNFIYYKVSLSTCLDIYKSNDQVVTTLMHIELDLQPKTLILLKECLRSKGVDYSFLPNLPLFQRIDFNELKPKPF